MIDFKHATPKMINQIINVMSVCFNEPLESVDFFIKNKSDLKRCYVCVKDNDVVSLLHAIPSEICLDGKIYPSAYIYGACTLPQHRRQGYMSALLDYAHSDLQKQNLLCSFLVPENNGLKKLYQKSGYYDFFKIKQIEFSNRQLKKLCFTGNNKVKNFTNDYSYMEKLRNNIYNNINRVIYTQSDIEYAARLYESFGGKVLCTPTGYAICATENIFCLKIRDYTSAKESCKDLATLIYKNFPNYDTYIIETASNQSFFNQSSIIKYNGMIKPLGISAQKIINSAESKNLSASPYLGIALD